MKSHASNLLRVARGILLDVRASYPEYTGTERDEKRLSLLVEQRGLGVFTLDLPARLDSLYKGFETGRLDPTGTVRYSKDYPVPRLFAGLYMRLFDKNLCLKSDLDVNAAFFLCSLLALGKKTEVPCSRKRLMRSVKEYHDVERELNHPTLSWAKDELDPDGVGDSLHLLNLMVDDLPLYPTNRGEQDGRIKEILRRAQLTADLVVQALGQFEPFLYSEKRIESGRRIGLRHGPGAVAERKGMFDKNMFTNWPHKLNTWFPFDEFGKMPNDPKGRPRNHEVASRLIAVPKTAKGPRLIAAEPSEHLWCQMLLKTWFEDRIATIFDGSFIDFKNQQLSGEMARLGSLDKRFATVDLSSASDRLSCYVIERVFRRSKTLLHSLHACRTRYLYDGISSEPSYILLKKYASQGTAVTFPLQTLTFLILALSSCMKGKPSWSKIRRLRGKVQVFGDDIVIPTAGYEDLVDLLHTLQLKVNVNKSYVNGVFREACGTDALMGYDITPLKPKTTIPNGPASRKAVLDTYNNFFMKGLWNASESLGSTNNCDFLKRVAVMGRDAGATGRISHTFGSAKIHERICRGYLPTGVDTDEVRKDLQSIGYSIPRERFRYNARLHRFEVRSYSLRSRTEMRDRDCGYSGLLQFSIAEPVRGSFDLPRMVGVPEKPVLKDQDRWEGIGNLLPRSMG